MSSTPEREAVKSLLEGLSDLEIRELCVEALRRWHAGRPTDDYIQMHDGFGRHLVPLLAARKAVPPGDVNSLKEPFLDALVEPWMGGVAEFLN
jgi:hypothetical protein